MTKIFSTFLKETRELLLCGGNVKIGDVGASSIKVTPENRASHAKDIHDMFSSLHDSFKEEHGADLFGKGKKALYNGTAFSGSTKHFMNKALDNEEFTKHKPSVGDVDVMVPREHFDHLVKHLTPGKQFGKYTIVGVKKMGDAHALMRHENGEVHQIDFEKSSYKNDEPDQGSQFLHSSDWTDNKMGIKGMHHKLLINAAGLDHHKFSAMYGVKSRTDDSQSWESHPHEITKTLFGPKADANKVQSFRGVTQLIKDHIPAEQHQQIYDKFKTDSARTKGVDHSVALDHLRQHLQVKDENV